jgi:hypothetical protein
MSKQERDIRLDKRNKKIKERYIALSDKKYNSKKLYTNDAIFSMLEDEFFLAPITIEKIVFSKD